MRLPEEAMSFGLSQHCLAGHGRVWAVSPLPVLAVSGYHHWSVSVCDAPCACITRLGSGTCNYVCVAHSLVCWPSSEGTLSWPDLLSDPSVMSSTLQRLAQGRPGCMLGSEEDGASLVSPSLPAKYLSASGES